MHRQLISDVVAQAAALLDSGYGIEIKKREARLRSAIVKGLEDRPEVIEARWSPEWRPEMPYWPWKKTKKLGGFDLAIRYEGDTGYSTVVELKWSRHGLLDALDEAPWDCFKLAHAVETLEGVRGGLLLYAAPLAAWEKPARFTQLFEDALVSSEDLIADAKNVWRWLLETSAESRPTRLPPYVQVGQIARSALTWNGKPWEIRAASVSPNGEPWIHLDDEGWPIEDHEPVVLDWPHPEPGPGMEADDGARTFERRGQPPKTANEDLIPADVPGPTATWEEINWFALRYDGYGEHGGSDGLAPLANGVADSFRLSGSLGVLSLSELRGCLFFEARRYHHFGHAPDTASTPYIRALVAATAAEVASH